MPQLPTMPLERPIPEPDELEEGRLTSDPSLTPSHIKLGIAWLCATVMGVVTLVYSTMSQWSPTSTMLGLIGLLVAYVVYGSFLKKKNTIQFADSLYYMSFLWALFALIAAFVIWPAPKLTTDAVFTTFGYALLTTFCGMLLRLVVIQFQATLPDRILHAQEAIDRQVAALNQQINEATMEITSFRDRAGRDLVAMHHDLMKSLVDVREKISEEYRTMTTMMSAGFESSLKDMLSRLAAIEIPQDILTTEVAKVVATVEKRGEEVEKAVQRLEKSLMETAETATRFGASLYESEGAKRIGAAVNDLSGTIKERTEQFDKITTALEASRSELEGQLNSLQSLRSVFTNVAEQLSTLETELRDLSAHAISADVKNGLMHVQEAVHASLDASKAIESTMRGVMVFLKERVTQEGPTDGK